MFETTFKYISKPSFSQNVLSQPLPPTTSWSGCTVWADVLPLHLNTKHMQEMYYYYRLVAFGITKPFGRRGVRVASKLQDSTTSIVSVGRFSRQTPLSLSHAHTFRKTCNTICSWGSNRPSWTWNKHYWPFRHVTGSHKLTKNMHHLLTLLESFLADSLCRVQKVIVSIVDTDC